MNQNLYHPEGMAFTTQKRTLIREAIIGPLFCLCVLLIQGFMSEREAAQNAADGQAKAMSLLQACMNGYPIMTRHPQTDEIEGFVLCSASKEQKL